MNNIQQYAIRHEKILHDLINNLDIKAPRIKEAMLYTLFPGGKRFRPMLVYLCGEILNANQDTLDIIAASIELIHCYSLVHDDLPAMDNDDFRRGKPSCHRAFDEATAILVGDALQSFAIETLLTHLPQTLNLQQIINITLELTKASGPEGMISGQSLDLTELANPSISLAQLEEVHTLKTGKLISSCINMVIEATNPQIEYATSLKEFANYLGLAFQMQDDYLDKYAQNHLGKGRESDAANQKTTFANLYSQRELAELIKSIFKSMQKSLNIFCEKANNLNEFIKNLECRTTN